MLAAGKLDRRIDLQQAAVSRDASGGAVETWSTFASAWASARPLSGRALQAAQQRASSADTIFELRHRADISEAARILHRGEIYQILWIDDIGRGEGLHILAQRVRPQAQE